MDMSTSCTFKQCTMCADFVLLDVPENNGASDDAFIDLLIFLKPHTCV